jgi:hypothetical protein
LLQKKKAWGYAKVIHERKEKKERKKIKKWISVRDI